MKRYLVVLLLIFGILGTLVAQDTEDNLVSAWATTDLDAEEGDDPIIDAMTFLRLDEETLLQVSFGDDILYTLNDDGVYSGVPLFPLPFDFTAILTIIDEDTIEITSVATTGTFSFETHIRYTRTDSQIGIWTEPERNLIEFSMLQECLARVDVIPPPIFSDPDPILAILIDEDAGELLIGTNLLTGGGGTYELIEEDVFGDFPLIATRTAIVGEDVIDFSLYSIAGGRDDCEIRYDTQFVPFDGEYEDLFTRVDDMLEESEDE